MSTIRRGNFVRRNDRCPCGSGRKFKHCCSSTAVPQPSVHPVNKLQYIDSGEVAVRWMIADETATRFFADKDNRAIVFQDKADAIAIATLEVFKDQAPGEINIAGVGETKFELLKNKIPYVEVTSAEEALRLVMERLEVGQAGELTETKPLELSDDANSENETVANKAGNSSDEPQN